MFVRKRMILYVLMLLIVLICPAIHLSGQTVNETFPRETLASRISKVKRKYNLKIAFDEKELRKIEVPALSGEGKTTEEILRRSLENTDFVLIKNDNGSFAIAKEEPAEKSESREIHPPGNGTLKGRVVENETSEPLIGATIRIMGTDRGTMTNLDGYYTFDKVSAGGHTIEVAYMGYTTRQVNVNIPASRTATYDVTLSVDSKLLDEVVISGIRRERGSVPHASVQQVTQEIKELQVVASGISSEQISRSADRNAAQAVAKVSGVSIVDDKFVIVRGLNPRYNMTYLNDNVAPSTETNSRAFALDLIPSRVIDKIIVQKSPSPDVQADATGGVVKIYTKEARAVKHFDLEFQIGYRPGTSFQSDFLTYNGGKFDFLGFDDGTRALPKEVPGYGSLIRAQLSPSEYAKTFNPTLHYGKKQALPNMQLTANYYDAWMLFGRTLSSLTSFSYKNEYNKNEVFRQQGVGEEGYGTTDRIGPEDRNTNTVQSNLMQNFTYTWSKEHVFFLKNFLLLEGADVTVVRDSRENLPTNFPTLWQKDITLSYSQRFLYAGNLGGRHLFSGEKHTLDWNAGYTFSRQETPDQRVVRLAGANQELMTGDSALQWRARGLNPMFADDDVTIPRTLGIISRIWSRNSESVYNASLDYSFNWKPWLTAKLGTFQQWKSRSLDRRLYTVHEGNVIDPDIRIFSQMLNDNFVNPALARFRMQDLPNVWSGEYLNDNFTGLKVFDRTSGSDTYRGTEQNNSAYLLLSFTPANRLVEVYGGLRYEYNRQKIAAAIPPTLQNPINEPILVDNPTHSWLPSVSLSLRPSEMLVFRTSYGKTVNRPEFREVSPFKELDFVNNTILEGNPELISASVDNYDLRLEFYPNAEDGDAVSAGVFYKEIKNPIERINTSYRNISVFPSISYANASSATLKGLEVELRKSLSFIPLDVFRYFSVTANASFIESKAKFDAAGSEYLITERSLQGQAPYLFNAGLFYDNPGWGSRLGLIYNTAGESLYAAGRGYRYSEYIRGPIMRGSLIELPRRLLDISYTQRIGKGLQMKVTVQNLLNEAVVIAEDYNFSNKYEKLYATPVITQETGSDGSRERKDYGDNISSEYNPGRYFSFSLSYSF